MECRGRNAEDVQVLGRKKEKLNSMVDGRNSRKSTRRLQMMNLVLCTVCFDICRVF